MSRPRLALVIREHTMIKPSLIAAAALLLSSVAPAQINSSNIKWGPAPSGLPKGALSAVMAGNPDQRGVFTIRLKAPAGYVVRPHSHPTDEHVTVISGQMSFGMGSRLDRDKAKTLVAGGFTMMPAGMNHYAISRTGGVIQITGQGPFAIKYVNPADDPRRK